jgi:hypothetical protein
MAIPIRSIPVLEGAAARRFEREARKAEQERETINFSKQINACRAIIKKAREKGTLK